MAAASSHIQVYRCWCLQDFHSRVESAVSGDDLAQLLYKVFKSGHEQEDERGAARAAQSAKCKLEIKVWSHKTSMYLGHRVLELKLTALLCHTQLVVMPQLLQLQYYGSHADTQLY